MGEGYIIVEPRASDDILFFTAQNATDYPLFNIYIQLYDYNAIIKEPVIKQGDKIYLNKEVVDKNSLTYGSFDLSAKIPIDLPFKNDIKENQNEDQKFIVFKTIYRHGATVQYLITWFDSYKKINRYAYKIYSIDINNLNLELLKESGNVPDEVWEENFHFKKLYDLVDLKSLNKKIRY